MSILNPVISGSVYVDFSNSMLIISLSNPILCADDVAFFIFFREICENVGDIHPESECSRVNPVSFVISSVIATLSGIFT
jgi:hypothetical protein